MSIWQDPLKGNAARVTTDGEGLVLAVTQPEEEFISHEKEKSFVLASAYSATANDEVVFLCNDDASDEIIVTDIIVSADAACCFTIFRPTSGTAGGTTVAPVNLFLGSSITAEATAYGNAAVTGSLTGDTLGSVEVGASDPFDFKFGGSLVIPKNESIAVTVDTTCAIKVDILFHYAPKIQF